MDVLTENEWLTLWVCPYISLLKPCICSCKISVIISYIDVSISGNSSDLLNNISWGMSVKFGTNCPIYCTMKLKFPNDLSIPKTYLRSVSGRSEEHHV